MLTLLVKYTARPDCREKYVCTVEAEGLLSAIRAESGCLRYDYYYAAQDQNEILLVEQWVDEAHQQAHMQQPHMARLMELKTEYIDSTVLQRAELH